MAGQLNMGAFISLLVSPCRSCVEQDRGDCAKTCDSLNRFRQYLIDFHKFTAGGYERTEVESYSIRRR